MTDAANRKYLMLISLSFQMKRSDGLRDERVATWEMSCIPSILHQYDALAR
jgi:hypothetical protein